MNQYNKETIRMVKVIFYAGLTVFGIQLMIFLILMLIKLSQYETNFIQ